MNKISGLEKFTYNANTGEYYLAGFSDFFIQQKKEYPNMSDLYKAQLIRDLENYSERIRSKFPILCQH